MKRCPKCKLEKSSTLFGKSKRAKDGLSTYCKDCLTVISSDRYNYLKETIPDFKEKERLRKREMHLRLGYKDKYRPSTKSARDKVDRYKDRYPEKARAITTCCRMKPKVKGNHLHHWSYNKVDLKSVFELSRDDHNKLHRFLVYDQERFMYRRYDTNELLDTRESHEAFIAYVLENLQ